MPSPPPAASPDGGVLAGTGILQLGQLLTGPFAGHLQADLGAEVIKIEQPGSGDSMRDSPPATTSESA